MAVWDQGSGNNYLGRVNKVISAVNSIPEPSAFGLLAGVGALALVASRRRHR
ncbi:MAG: PEP-CTERM sorting domain-containing protein [Opitutales bacterium]|nr:PEP-CTERM sorting domain-containing protein [Opitutales bacterium]